MGNPMGIPEQKHINQKGKFLFSRGCRHEIYLNRAHESVLSQPKLRMMLLHLPTNVILTAAIVLLILVLSVAFLLILLPAFPKRGSMEMGFSYGTQSHLVLGS